MHTVHNARMTMLATALNNLGVGSILAGVLAPMVNGSIGGFASVVAWVILGADLIAMSQVVLGRLR